MDLFNEPILFLATANPARSREFYEKSLGFKFVADEPYALIFDLDGLPLRIQKLSEFTPQQHTILGWSVREINKIIYILTEATDVQMLRYDFLEQDSDGVWTSPSGAKIAWFKDPDGNILSLTEAP